MKAKGFTLIELVVVIVILGILAATAAPKFMDLQKDARTAALRGIKGAISSAITMLESKAIVKGATTGCNKICVTSNCPQGEALSCDNFTSGSDSINYVDWIDGHYFNSSTAYLDIPKIVELDDDYVIENPGPSGNICIQHKDRKVSCASFYSNSDKNYTMGEDADGCMVHMWTYAPIRMIEVVAGGC
jgi:prepilin-type N-terminal cleavage/methylation domain-containing protein